MALPPSIKKPLDQGIRFRNEERAETRPAIFTPEVTLDMFPNRGIGQPPAYDGLLSRRGKVPASILIDPRVYPYTDFPDDYFFLLDAQQPWISFTKPTGSLATYLGIPGAHASALWTFEETTGVFLDQIGSSHLTASAGTLTGRTAVGLWNGVDHASIKTCEFPAHLNSTGSSVLSTTALDTADSVAIVTVFRTALDNGVTQGGMGKFDPTVGGGTGGGYGFHFTVNNTVQTEVAGGGGAAGGHFTRDLQNNSVCDGAYHYLVMSFSRASSSLASYTDSAKVNPTLSASIGTLANSAHFTVGSEYPGMQTGHWQPLWVAVLTGSAAETMFWASASMDAWWGTVVNKAPPGMTYSKLGPSMQPIGYVPGTGTLLNVFGVNQVEFVYHPRFDNPNRLGMALRGETFSTTLTNNSYVTGGLWTVTGTLLIPRVGDCPKGFKNGTLLHKTNVSGNVNVSFTPGTRNYVSVMVKRTGSAQPVVRVVQESNNSVVASITCTSSLEGEWGHYRLLFPTAGASRLELHPSDPNDTSGSAFFQYVTHYSPTGLLTGSDETMLPLGVFGITNSGPPISCFSTASVIFDNFAEVQATFIPLTNWTSNKGVWDNFESTANRRAVYVSQSNGNVVSEIQTAASGVVPPSMNFGANLGFQTTVKLAWNSTGSYTVGYSVTSSAGLTSSFGLSGSSALTASVTPRILTLASGSAAASALSLLKVYSKTKIM